MLCMLSLLEFPGTPADFWHADALLLVMGTGNLVLCITWLYALEYEFYFAWESEYLELNVYFSPGSMKSYSGIVVPCQTVFLYGGY